MSTQAVTPDQSTPLNPLVEKIRGAHPGAYDDMDDGALTKAVLAKYPQYEDLARPASPIPGAPPPKGTLPNGGATGEGPIAKNLTSFEAQASHIPENTLRMIGAKHWPVIDAKNWGELGEDIKSLNPVVRTGGEVDYGATAANLLPLAISGEGIGESPLGKAVRSVPVGRIAGAGAEGLKVAGDTALKHVPIAGPAIREGVKTAIRDFRDSAPAKPVYPGASLPEHPGIFPGANLPEKPPAELLQGNALGRGSSVISEPSSALDRIPVKPIYPGAHLPEHPGIFPGANLPETPPTEVLQAQPLAQGGQPIPDPAAGLRKIPVRGIPESQTPPTGGDVSLPKPPAKTVRQAIALGPNAKVMNQSQSLGQAIPIESTGPLPRENPIQIPDQHIIDNPRYSQSGKYAYQAGGRRPAPYVWEEGGGGRPDLEEDKAINQDLQGQFDKDQRIVWSEAGRERAARNSMDTPKSILIQQSRIAKPIPIPADEDLTPTLQKSVEEARANKVLAQVKKDHPDWTESQQLQEAAKRAKSAR